ncbi:hypothetical protein [Psychroserpens mesophilus]|uniref:hypothetical protein n=1 Tax=Psychroserpens mesophilus TaxID=325473 RepID=UPI003F495956
MAPIKFEDKLKDKLENRSLQPSEDAWSTLANRLDKEEDKNSNTRFWWLGIAASIIGVILITTQFYKSTEEVKDLPVVVDTKAMPQRDSGVVNDAHVIDNVLTNSEEKNNIVETENATNIAAVSSNKANQNQKSDRKENGTEQSEELQSIVASQEKSTPERVGNNQVKTLTQEELKIIEVVDVIKQLQASESSVSDKEIDSLLKQAQREILKQRLFDETTRTVSADALLQDVEVELEQSFRDKVFEALKSSYNSVKTAVAERRN